MSGRKSMNWLCAALGSHLATMVCLAAGMKIWASLIFMPVALVVAFVEGSR